MKTTKLLSIGLVSTASLGLLAACGGGNSKTSSESNLDKSFTYMYKTEPESMDYVYTNLAASSSHTINFVEGLLSYDQYKQIQPAMAESWEASEDGKTYTYKIREGVKWVDADGNAYDDVKPSDWVTSLKHAVASESEALYLIAGSITGLQDYIDGKTTDFSTVGIKADDEKGTLTYTLSNPEPFWNSKTTYSVLHPINEAFLKEKGAKFGAVATDSILYNGPFIPTKFDAKSEITYKANPNYWDKKNVHIDTVSLSYYDGSKPEELYNAFKDGKYNEALLYPTESYYKDVNEKDVTWTPTDSTTRFAGFNFDRQTFNHTSKDAAQQEAAKKAILNTDFRQAITYAFDKAKYVDQKVGEQAGAKPVRNSLVPDDFVQIDGKDYGTAVQTELEALNPQWKELKIAQGADGIYNVEAAKKAFDKAKAGLKAEGVEVSKEHPIVLDVPVDQSVKYIIAQATSFKNSIEKNLDGEVQINVVKLDTDTFNNSAYYAPTGKDADYDIMLFKGWSPDYQDPATYLNIFAPKNGDAINVLGFESEATLKGDDHGKAAKSAIHIEEYQKLLDAANDEYADVNTRYANFAKADAWLVDNVLAIPIYQDGAAPKLFTRVPFSGAESAIGNYSEYGLKYRKYQKTTVTAAEYEKAQKAWEAKVEEKATAAEK
ncbi:peptide ABC transporter substrate-binding protein [Pseudolactococcus yaeyamensis]